MLDKIVIYIGGFVAEPDVSTSIHQAQRKKLEGRRREEVFDSFRNLVESADNHYDNLDVKGLESDLKEMSDLLVAMRLKHNRLRDNILDVDIRTYSKFRAKQIASILTHKLISEEYPNIIEYANSMPIGLDLMLRESAEELPQQELDCAALNYVNGLARTDLRDARKTGDTRDLINQTLSTLVRLEDSLSPEVRDDYLSVIGKIFTSISDRLDAPPENYSDKEFQDFGRNFYETFLEQGRVLDNVDNTILYPREKASRSGIHGIISRLVVDIFDHTTEIGNTRYKFGNDESVYQTLLKNTMNANLEPESQEALQRVKELRETYMDNLAFLTSEAEGQLTRDFAQTIRYLNGDISRDEMSESILTSFAWQVIGLPYRKRKKLKERIEEDESLIGKFPKDPMQNMWKRVQSERGYL